jgi:hypothetical protein
VCFELYPKDQPKVSFSQQLCITFFYLGDPQ